MSFKILLSPSETDSGGGETDTGGDPDGVQVRIDAAVEKATQGLLKKNDELKGEKQNARRQLDSLVESIESLGGAEGLKSLRDMRDRLENDEIGRLVAEGKHEEALTKKTDAMRADFEKRMIALEEAKNSADTERDELAQRLKGKTLETDVRAACASLGVVESAVSDVLLRADHAFFEHADHGMAMRDTDGGVVYGKDGKTPKTIHEWLEDQSEISRHWFPVSKGAGAAGQVGDESTSSKDFYEIRDLAEWKRKREKLGISSGYPGSEL